MLPGRPVAMMLFKTWGYITMAQALTFTSDFKLGHYMKVPLVVLFFLRNRSAYLTNRWTPDNDRCFGPKSSRLSLPLQYSSECNLGCLQILLICAPQTNLMDSSWEFPSSFRSIFFFDRSLLFSVLVPKCLLRHQSFGEWLDLLDNSLKVKSTSKFLKRPSFRNNDWPKIP